jgi:class 3 adenylate cyclase
MRRGFSLFTRCGIRASPTRRRTLTGRTKAIEANSGHVFKTIGDAFCAVFARPEDAVWAALEIERAIAREDFSEAGDILEPGPGEVQPAS